ncbi:MAG: transposase [Bacteroidota bacterium]|nr:transposase [Bacteroidota bacterium]
MPFTPNNIYHVYNQGNNRQKIFFTRKDYITFLNLYKRLFSDNCSTIAGCLMPNHFHFMIYTDERCDTKIKQCGIYLDPITNNIRKLLSGYARIFNTQYQQTGSVFRQKTKGKCLSAIEIKPDSSYLIQDYYVNCFHYIHQNPLIAKLTQRLEDWEFSSFKDYAGFREGTLCQKELAVLHCGYNLENFIEKSYELVDKKLIDLFT